MERHFVIPFLELLTKKEQVVEELFAMTDMSVFFGKEEEVPGFIQYIDERETLINIMKEVDNEIKDFVIEDLKAVDSEAYERALQLQASIKDYLTKLVLLDKKNNQIMGVVYDKLKGSVKNINTNKNIVNAYQAYTHVVDGMYLDKKN